MLGRLAGVSAARFTYSLRVSSNLVSVDGVPWSQAKTDVSRRARFKLGFEGPKRLLSPQLRNNCGSRKADFPTFCGGGGGGGPGHF